MVWVRSCWMGFAVGLLSLSGGVSAAKCSVKSGHEDRAHLCDSPNCDVFYPAFCDVEGASKPKRCVVKSGEEDHAEYCEYPHCDEYFPWWCELHPDLVEEEEHSGDRCVVKGGGSFESHPECREKHCERKHGEFCELRDDLKTPFEKAITIGDVAKIVPWKIPNYDGSAGYQAAEKIYWDIVDAINVETAPRTWEYDYIDDLKIFCGSGNIENDRREFAAFMASVVEDTATFLLEEEQNAPNSYCEWQNQGDKRNDAVCCVTEWNGDRFPCDSRTENCTYSCDFKGRGMLFTKGSLWYMNLSEWYFSNHLVLLRNPERVLSEPNLKWVSAIAFWMESWGSYEQQCPAFKGSFGAPSDPSSAHSCHHAMQDDKHGGGFGETLRLLDTDYAFLSCGKSDKGAKAALRWEYFLDATTALGVRPHPNCEVGQADCDVSGMEIYSSFRGYRGNPLLGGEYSKDCPQCGKPECVKETKTVDSCEGRPEWAESDCPRNLEYQVFTCKKEARSEVEVASAPTAVSSWTVPDVASGGYGCYVSDAWWYTSCSDPNYCRYDSLHKTPSDCHYAAASGKPAAFWGSSRDACVKASRMCRA